MSVSPAHGIIGWSLLPILIFFSAALIYVFKNLIRDILFYTKNDWDLEKDSGVPRGWIRVGSTRHLLSRKSTFLFVYPLLIAILGFVVVVTTWNFFVGL